MWRRGQVLPVLLVLTLPEFITHSIGGTGGLSCTYTLLPYTGVELTTGDCSIEIEQSALWISLYAIDIRKSKDSSRVGYNVGDLHALNN